MPSKNITRFFLNWMEEFPIIRPAIYALRYPLPLKIEGREYEARAMANTNIILNPSVSNLIFLSI